MKIELKGSPVEKARIKKALELIVEKADNVEQIENLAKLSSSEKAKNNLDIAVDMFCH